MDDINRKELEKTLRSLNKERAKHEIGTPERDKIESYYERLYQLKLKEDEHEASVTDRELQRAEQAYKDAAELELEEKQQKSDRRNRIIDRVERWTGGLISAGSFLLLLDFESDHSLRSKAWPVVERLIFRKK